MPDEPSRPWQRDSTAASDAAHMSWANTPDRSARTAPARAAQFARFLDEVDPDRILPEPERERRAEQAKRAYFRAISHLGVRARRRKAVIRRGDAA